MTRSLLPGVCSGPLSRRQLLQVGTLGPLSLGLSQLLATPATARPLNAPPKAKSCILLFMWGGPSHLDTWDLKPEAPAEVRGEFKPIATTVPGLQISEHFPRLAKLAKRYTLIRSMAHTDPAHLSSVHHLMTGRLAPRPNSDADPPSRNDTPHIGSVLARFQPSGKVLPPFVSLPWAVSHPAAPGGVAPGQDAGFLGPNYDPFLVTGDPNAANFRVGGLSFPDDLPADRLNHRRALLQALDRGTADTTGYSSAQQKALGLLTTRDAEAAFDLNKEPAALRDRYGRHPHGQSCLLARRLIEAGTRLVCVNWPDDKQFYWDTHGNNFAALKTRLMPPADQGFAALLEDMQERGLLDETLVVWVGEFGRAPKITAGNAGREHWPRCYSAVLAGGGVRGGGVFGRSDRTGEAPLEHPVSPADLTATVYEALGIHPETLIADRLGRELTLTEGRVLTDLFT